jgi:hypothetical protein
MTNDECLGLVVELGEDFEIAILRPAYGRRCAVFGILVGARPLDRYRINNERILIDEPSGVLRPGRFNRLRPLLHMGGRFFLCPWQPHKYRVGKHTIRAQPVQSGEVVF